MIDGDEGSPQLPAGRKAQLAAFVAEQEQVTVAALAERFGVSTDTVRRDLDQLDAEGLVVRTHGGAVSPGAMLPTEKKLDVRMQLQSDAKEEIAAIAVGLVQNSSVVMINAGTTTLAVARHLRNHRELTIATNNLRIASEMSPQACRDLYVFGGTVRLAAQSTVGPVRLQVSNGAGVRELDLHSDIALISVGAVSADGGYSTSNLAEAAMMNDMISRARRVAILADSSKFSRQLFAQIAELGRADYLITEVAPPADLADALRRQGVEVLTPDHPTPGSQAR